MAKGESSKKNLTSEPSCLICESGRASHFLDKADFTYYRCRKCDGIYTWPIKDQKFYLKTKTYLTDPKLYAANINPYGQRWMAEQLDRLYAQKMDTHQKGTLFEVGAGAGYLSLFALARGWEVAGIETSKPAVDFAKHYLRVPLEHSIIESYKPKNKFDAIAMVEVLEHFLHPLQALDSLKKLAKEKTFIFGTTPNTSSDHWQKSDQDIYVPDDHIFLFNEHSLRRFASKAGIKDFSVEFFGSGEQNDSNLMYAGVIEGAQ